MLYRIDVSKIVNKSTLKMFIVKNRNIILTTSTLTSTHLIEKYKQNFHTLDLTNSKNCENYNLLHKYHDDKSRYTPIKKFDND